MFKLEQLSSADLEPQIGLQFTSNQSLISHTIKHPLEAKGEHWEKIIDGHLIEQARENGHLNRAILNLAKAYEEKTDHEVAILVREMRGHHHFVRIEIENNSIISSQDIIYCWSQESRMFIVLARRVRKEENFPYQIISSYRTYLSGSDAQFEKKIQRDLINKVLVHALNLVKDHKERLT